MDNKTHALAEQPPEGLFGDELNIDFRHYIRILRKHRWSIIGLTSLIILLSAFYVYTATPIYKSTATLLIESKKANVVSIEEIYGFDGANAEYYQTQFELLKSRALAEKVIKKLNLQQHPLYNNAGSPGPLSMNTLRQLGLFPEKNETINSLEAESKATDTLTSAESVETGDKFAYEQPLMTDEERRLQLLVDKFTAALSIEPVRRTQLV